jgi:ABC-type transporter Mla subunit MlaD
MGLLGSDASIDFVPQPPVEGQPPPDRSPVPPNSELAGTRAATVGTLLSRASDVVPSTQETLNDLRRSMQRLEKMAPLMEETLREYRDLARIGRDLVPDLRRTNTEVADLARAAREALPEARRAAEDAGAASRNVAKLAERADVLLQANQDKLVKAVDNFNDAATRAAAMLSEENQKNVNAIVRNTRRASDRFESIANNVDEASKEGKEAVKEGRKAGERLNRLLNQVEEILQTLSATTRPLGERGPRMVQNADELLEKLNRSAGDFTSLLGVLDRSDGTFRRFLTDPTVYNRLDDVLCGVQRALPRVDRILRDFETFADKLARHPEAIGLGGVVRPGSGLKEPPTPPGVYRPMH